jgi:hypothetical protein
MPKPTESGRFSVISGTATGLEPPAGLGEAGVRFWRRVQAEYRVADIGGLCLLEQICGAIDTIESITQALAVEGPALRRNGGLRANPLLRDQLQNRAFVARSLERLGISVQEVQPVGHPPRPTSWSGDR